jgi:hypothetical protein
VQVTGEYFDPLMVDRQRLLWTIATRRQLERWESIVADVIRDQWVGRRATRPNEADVWSAEIERHLTLVAARNLIRALDLPPAAEASVEPTLRAELIEGRDLVEHWEENMPVFNVTPRVEQPKYRSGKQFATSNPGSSPYGQISWNPKMGALLLPQVSAPRLHQLLDAVEAEVLKNDPVLRVYVPPRAASPWIQQDGEWWPSTTG